MKDIMKIIEKIKKSMPLFFNLFNFSGHASSGDLLFFFCNF